MLETVTSPRGEAGLSDDGKERSGDPSQTEALTDAPSTFKLPDTQKSGELSSEQMGRTAESAGGARDAIRAISFLTREMFPFGQLIEQARAKIEGLKNAKPEVAKLAVDVLDIVKKYLDRQSEKLNIEAVDLESNVQGLSGEAQTLQQTETDVSAQQAEDTIGEASVAAQYPDSDYKARKTPKKGFFGKLFGRFQKTPKSSADVQQKSVEASRKAGDRLARASKLQEFALTLSEVIDQMRGGAAEPTAETADAVAELKVQANAQQERIAELEAMLKESRAKLKENAAVVGGSELAGEVQSKL